MTIFCIQIQPDLAPTLAIDALKTYVEDAAKQLPFVSRSGAIDGDKTEDGPYLNLMFETDQPSELWDWIVESVLEDETFGDSVSQCAMVICTETEDWDEYLLLYHFDETVEIDSLEDA
ncbi:hypothetical protein LIN78_02445 [Leeia sp. TBRC 13508]|uniref:Uncharacterized protein n=1 Tax=Leeia speluncae TaxID=2884804 RepID=A0ABS8D336_9NEIS|nr:hypothetical protein [Leeia speluncae]MCB6182413.1 hypothetical protein [Leeia speluncae]